MLERIKQYAGLENLDQFLAGKITHFVEHCYGPPKIKTFKEALEQTDDYGRRVKDLKLLSLFGRSGGDLAWRVNDYQDGSGSWREMTPCLSREEALEVARKVFAEHEANVAENPHRGGPSKEWADAAEKLGIQLSQQYLDRLAQVEQAAKQARIDRLKQQLTELGAA
jgi:hypothetical protein